MYTVLYTILLIFVLNIFLLFVLPEWTSSPSSYPIIRPAFGSNPGLSR